MPQSSLVGRSVKQVLKDVKDAYNKNRNLLKPPKVVKELVGKAMRFLKRAPKPEAYKRTTPRRGTPERVEWDKYGSLGRPPGGKSQSSEFPMPGTPKTEKSPGTYPVQPAPPRPIPWYSTPPDTPTPKPQRRPPPKSTPTPKPRPNNRREPEESSLGVFSGSAAMLGSLAGVFNSAEGPMGYEAPQMSPHEAPPVLPSQPMMVPPANANIAIADTFWYD